MALVAIVPNDFIGIAMIVKVAIHKWCEEKVSELAQFEKQIQRNWTSCGEFVVEESVEC